jgi:ubiquinol oxidase
MNTQQTPRRHYGVAARALFVLLDMLYGKARTLSKFKVLELAARVPYQSWEQVAYIAITHMHRRPDRGVPRSAGQRAVAPAHPRRAHRPVRPRSGRRQPRVKFFWLPQAIAFVYYQLSLLLLVVRPAEPQTSGSS